MQASAVQWMRSWQLRKKYNLKVVEDAAQGVNAFYKGKALGTIGDFGCYSFHETKNYSMGEGGAILFQDDRYLEPAEILREKGTNRSQYFRGQIDKIYLGGLWIVLSAKRYECRLSVGAAGRGRQDQ